MMALRGITTMSILKRVNTPSTYAAQNACIISKVVGTCLRLEWKRFISDDKGKCRFE